MRSAAALRRLALAGCALIVPSVAHAHLALRASDPAPGARLERSPGGVTLWFTQRPQLAFSRVFVVGPAGGVALGPVASDTGNALRVVFRAPLDSGEYVVRWQTASADGHTIRGEFRFTVLASAPVAGVGAAAAAATVVHDRHDPVAVAAAGRQGYRVARWVEFLALTALLGALGFRHLVLPAAASRGVPTSHAAARARLLGEGAAALYLASALARAYNESVTIHGPDSALDAAQLRGMLLETTWGMGWLTGVGGALLALAAWSASRRNFAGSGPLAVAGGLAMAASPALTGHAASDTPVVLSVLLDWAHVLGAGVWVGGLLALLAAGVPGLRRAAPERADTDVAALVNSYHPVALVCVPLVVFSGAGSALMRAGAPAALIGSEYGRVLAIKLLLFAAVAGLGLVNSMRIRRRLGSARATRTFRYSAAGELILAAAVVAVTTALIVTPLPQDSP